MHPTLACTRFAAITISAAAILTLSHCSVDFVPVPAARVNSARMAEQPLLRGQGAPGSFTRSWTFAPGADGTSGYSFDPSEIDISSGIARLKDKKNVRQKASGRREVTIVTNFGAPFVALDSFEEVTGPTHHGQLAYQLSSNNSTWHFYDGKAWVPAGGPNAGQANTATEIKQAIGKFHSEVGNGSLYIKAFLISPTGIEPVELKQIIVQGIAPRMDEGH